MRFSVRSRVDFPHPEGPMKAVTLRLNIRRLMSFSATDALRLFAVLPIGTRPVVDADETSGWRGTPTAPRLWFKIALTTVVSAVVWVLVYLVIESEIFSFRHGLLAPAN